VVLTTLGERVQFAAVGSSIVATGFYLRGTPPSTSYEGATAVYDTRTAELATSDLLPLGIRNNGVCDRAVAIGNTLYAFESFFFSKWELRPGLCIN
jgi:hypothetical protein